LIFRCIFIFHFPSILLVPHINRLPTLWWANRIFAGIKFHNFIQLSKFAKIWCTQKYVLQYVVLNHWHLTSD